jgi:hypothetical protein
VPVPHEVPPQPTVSRILSAFAAALQPRLRRDDHSSSPVITDGIKRPTRKPRTGRSLSTCRQGLVLPYLALLHAGFCLPPVLPRARCALTAPFHPYSPPPLRATAQQALRPVAPKRAKRAKAERYLFCATVLRVAPTGRYPAHCPAEFGLSSRLRPLRELRRGRPVKRHVEMTTRTCLAVAREASEGGRSSGLLRRLSPRFPATHPFPE